MWCFLSTKITNVFSAVCPTTQIATLHTVIYAKYTLHYSPRVTSHLGRSTRLQDLKPFFHLLLCHSIFPVRPSFSVYLPLSLLWPCRPEGAESFSCHHRCESQLGALPFSCRLASCTEERSGTEVQYANARFALNTSPLLLLPWISHGNETVMRAEQAERCRATFVIFISTQCKGGK